MGQFLSGGRTIAVSGSETGTPRGSILCLPDSILYLRLPAANIHRPVPVIPCVSSTSLVILIRCGSRRKMRHEIAIDLQEAISASARQIKVREIFRAGTLRQGEHVVVGPHRAALGGPKSLRS